MNMEFPSLIVLVRHAESTRNAEKRNAKKGALVSHPSALTHYKSENMRSELTENGVFEAHELGKALKKKFGSFDAMISSHYVRTDQTARIIAKELKIVYSYDERLSERKKGRFDAYSRKGIQELFPEEYAKREKLGFYMYRPPEGESLEDLRKRTEGFIKEMLPQYAGKKVLIVTHGGNVALFRQIFESLTNEETEKVLTEVRNCSVTRYSSDGKKLKLEKYNYIPFKTSGSSED